jgi:hypothetical protein
MGMYDTYQPVPALSCPVCERPLESWQGKDADNALLIWRQGVAAPVGQDIDDPEIAVPFDEPPLAQLPAKFDIYSYDCGCPFRVDAKCEAPEGTWLRTTLVTAQNAERGLEESKDRWAKRKRWLASARGG